MRKFGLLLLCLVMSIVSYAQVAEPYVEIFLPMVNVRSGASEDYTVRGVMFSQDQLTVTGKVNFDGEWRCTGMAETDDRLWLRVDLQGIEGWVNYCVVNFAGDLDSLPVAEATYPEPIEWLNLATIPMEGIFFSRITDELGTAPDVPYVVASTRTRNYIHLRSEPRLDANILDHISGERVYVTGISSDGVWVQVEYDAKLTSCLQVADSVDDCPYERLSGWVARYLLSFPTDWQEIFAKES